MSCREHMLAKCLLDEVDESKWTDWERDFIYDIAERLERGSGDDLSDKQREKLEELWKKD